VKFFGTRRGLIGAALILLLALFLIRPGAGGLKTRLSRSISLALGRQVEIGKVRLRMLPQPGFDLQNFIVHDDPSFSAEPLLRAEEVTAAIRLAPLLRGRIEVSSLSLTEPSLNLVYNQAGHWNIENLLERTAKISVAPTAKARSETRPGFPYIEADRGRINLKIGQEKKPYALTNADFSIWQDSENAWAMRLKAQPVRTDFNLSDTGLLKVSGSWQRATTLRGTPLQFTLQWDRGQLGQLTKLISGADRGWRGALSATLTLTGNPEDLSITASSSVQDFRRYDIFADDALRLAAHCIAHYSSADRTLRQIICGAPVGDGTVRVQGNLGGLLQPRDYDFTLSAEELPVESLVRLARHIKKDLPSDLLASGSLNANLSVRASANGRPIMWEGDGQTSAFRLRSALTRTDLELGQVPFAIVSTEAYKNGSKTSSRTGKAPEMHPPEAHLDVGPFMLPLGRPTPAVLRGWASRAGYSFYVQGDAQASRLLQLARTLGIPAAQSAVLGTARIDLKIAGQWSGFAPPRVTGTAQLDDLRADVRGLNAPLEIASAKLNFSDDKLQIQGISASLGDSRWTGSLSLPRHCSSPQWCAVAFNLHTEELNTDQLNELFNPHPLKRPWYHLLSPSLTPRPSILTEVQAAGKLTATRMVIRDLTANHVAADAELHNGKLKLLDLHADVVGGKHSGQWQADFSVQPPVYSGAGSLEKVSLEEFAQATHDGWITGSARASYRLTTSGYTTAELLNSATGTLEFEMRNGTLPRIALVTAPAPLRIRLFKAHLILVDGKLEIQEGKLDAASGIYEVSGTASLGRNLNIRLVHDGAHAFSITGTVAEPRVVRVSLPETQAVLKP
jgi:AsmA-like protein